MQLSSKKLKVELKIDITVQINKCSLTFFAL